ncbi:hypothetical protein BLGI_1980 [Brevibacillus laterosporus GI-9]|nr:hypothetical protein BLGI_1980 [Brevibacillus laterosporus GI-9]
MNPEVILYSTEALQHEKINGTIGDAATCKWSKPDQQNQVSFCLEKIRAEVDRYTFPVKPSKQNNVLTIEVIKSGQAHTGDYYGYK